MQEKILLCHPVEPEVLARAEQRFPQFAWLRTTKDAIPEVVADVQIIYGPVYPEQVAAASKLKWVQSTSAGVERLSRSDVFLNGNFILTTSSGMHDSCAEHAMALLLGFTRRISFYARSNDPSIWKMRKGAAAPQVLAGSTLGILGLGAIGRSIARIARAMQMRTVGVSFHGRPVPEADETHAVSALDGLLSRFDYLILVLPSAPGTDGLLNAARLALLPKHAVVVNVGRGNSIDQAALIEALQAGRLAGAALDVFEKEPLPDDSPLYKMSNVVITPHIGGNRPDYHERAFGIFLENLQCYVDGKQLRNRVEKERGY